MAIVKKLTNDINYLERETLRLNKGGQGKRDPTLCPHCKKEKYHAAEACFKLVKNKDKRPTGWKSSLWWRGTVIIIINISKSSDKLLTHHANFSPTLDISTLTIPINADTTATCIVDSGATDIYPYSKHIPFGTKIQGRHSNRANPTIHWNRGLGLTPSPNRVSNQRTPHARLLPYLNRGRPILWCQLYSHLHAWSSNRTRPTSNASDYRLAWGPRVKTLENSPTTMGVKPTQYASQQKSGYISGI